MKFLVRSLFLLMIITTFNACAQKNTIVGVWEVKTDLYQAVYEIVEFKDEFFGKIHYYNDGITEYKGNNKKDDYFLTDVVFKDGKYINGKMYMPDGTFYHVIFTLKSPESLEVIMTIDGEPYQEIWKRKISN